MEIEKLLDRANRKLNEEGKKLLWEIRCDIQDHVENETKWKRYWELNQKISNLEKQLTGELTHSEIQKICQSEAETARLEKSQKFVAQVSDLGPGTVPRN